MGGEGMPTTNSNVFALRNSGLDAFLYADVGAELNGSALTILSMIARLGRDPWAEAARWATLPRAGAIEGLAQSMAQMPLVPSALAETRATAARLVQLLPATTPTRWPAGEAKANVSSAPAWLPLTLLYCAMALGAALSAQLIPTPSPAGATPTEPARTLSGAASVSAVPLGRDRNAIAPSAAPSGPRVR